MATKGHSNTKATASNVSTGAPEPQAHLTAPTRLTGAEILWATLVGEGVTDVFGYPGGAILPAYDALRKFPIRHVLVRHEQGAAHMADGYARASGEVGVAIATSGPGATNLVTGIATAMLDSIPIVCITGNVSSKVLGTDAFQEIDITGITLPVTKHNFLVGRAEDVAGALRQAFQIARSGRPGPVLVDITKDAQQATAVFDFEAAKPRPYRPHPMLTVEESGLAAAVELIRNSERPVILAGHGVIESGAMEQLRTLAERAQIPVGLNAAGAGRFSRFASVEPGHDGHARRGVGESRHSGSRSADCVRHAFRRSRDRHDLPLMRQRPRRFISKWTRQRLTRTSRWMWRWWAICARCWSSCCRVLAGATARHGSSRSRPARARLRCATSRTCLTWGACTRRT